MNDFVAERQKMVVPTLVRRDTKVSFRVIMVLVPQDRVTDTCSGVAGWGLCDLFFYDYDTYLIFTTVHTVRSSSTY